MAPSHILQIFLRVTIQNQVRIAQRVVIDEIIQLRPLRHGHIQRNRGILLPEEKKIRTLLLLEKSSDFHCLVRVVIQHFLKTIVVQFVFEVIG